MGDSLHIWPPILLLGKQEENGGKTPANSSNALGNRMTCGKS